MKGAHLTLDDRKIIQRDLENGMNRAQIAKELGKSPSTISKEIKLHKKFKLASAYGRGVRYFCENSGKFKECYGCKKEAASVETSSAYAINVPIIQSATLTNTTTELSKRIRNI